MLYILVGLMTIGAICFVFAKTEYDIFNTQKGVISYITVTLLFIFLYVFTVETNNAVISIIYSMCIAIALSSAWIDYTYSEIPGLCSLFLLILGLVRLVLQPETIEFSIILAAGTYICLTIFAMLSMGVGGGDIRFVSALALFIQESGLFCYLFLPLIFALIYALAHKIIKDPVSSVPFAPFACLGFCTSIFF